MVSRRLSLHVVAALAAVFVLAVAGTAVAPATAAPPPQELCGVCGDALSTEAPEQGVPLNVEHGALALRFGADGTGHWHARVRVTPGAADRLAANGTLREHVVRETYDHGRTVVEDPRNLTTSVENDTLVVDFDVPDAARTGPRGVVYADLLTRGGHEGGVRVVADRLEMAGPNGTIVTSGVDGMETTEGSVVWIADGDDAALGLSRDTALAFAPPGPLAGPATVLTVLLSALARTGPLLAPVVAVPTLLLGAVTATLLEFDERVPAIDPDRIRRALLGVGVGVCLLGVVGSLVSPGRATVALALLGAFYAAVVAGANAVAGRSPGRLAAVVLAAAAAAALAYAVRGGAGGALAVTLLGIGLFLPMGTARRVGGRSLVALVAGVLLVPLVLAVGMGTIATALSATLAGAVLLVWIGTIAALGAPLYVLGRNLS